MRAVNLIPGDQRGGASVGAGRSGGAAYALLAMLVGVALLAVVYGKASRAVSSEKSKAASLSAEAARDKAAAERLAPYTSFVALRKQREAAVQELVDTRFDWAHTFHEFGRVLTDQVSITSLDGQIGSGEEASSSSGGASSVSSATPAGAVPVFTVGGCATSQKAVAQTLQRLRLIDGVAEVTLQNSTRGESSAGTTGGSCPPGGPVFTISVAFKPLPSASEASSAASSQKSVSNETATPAPTPSTTSSGGEAR
jgi:Tfp pilus assembly protein PilN